MLPNMAQFCNWPQGEEGGNAGLVRCQGTDRSCVSGSSTDALDPQWTLDVGRIFGFGRP
jgi:hypothetical protein